MVREGDEICDCGTPEVCNLLFVCLSVCPSVRLSIHLVCLSVCLVYVYLPDCPCILTLILILLLVFSDM